MAGLSGALALFAFGGAVRALLFAANGTITQPPTLTTGSPPDTTGITDVTCGTISDFPAGVLQEYVGLSTDPALQCQCLEQVNDWLSTSNPPTRTLTRTIGTGVTTFTETTSSITTVVTTVVNTVVTATVTGNFFVGQTNVCCTIGASTVEVFYFAERGYTFESPSVYIGFSSLSAFDYCGVVGKPFVNTTVGFNPGELSTITSSPKLGSGLGVLHHRWLSRNHELHPANLNTTTAAAAASPGDDYIITSSSSSSPTTALIVI
ncbi:hypothetical protein Trco_004710 [Trichoderma cornu-damae]|uniref:Uncharacterized protein n=1 Tax=Trichoderma cornu-damae TaxID=654480 RepID=A0A9P8TV13_9HYPO|nr:hypothetical protein Trco_004710 [Trichoderma cornu-damae]